MRDTETVIGVCAVVTLFGMGLMGLALTSGGQSEAIAAAVVWMIISIVAVVWLRYLGAL